MNIIDSKNKKIIDELKKNSRKSIRDIAKATKLRPSTVHNRIDHLKETGVIERFTVKLNNKKIEENFICFMLIQTEKQIDNRAFKNPHIKEVFGVTGDHDLLLKMKFADIEQFNSFIIDFRKKHNIKKTHTMISTICLKEEI